VSAAQLEPFAARIAERGHRAHRGEMLRGKTRPRAPGAHVDELHGLSADGRERDGGAHELPTPLAVRGIDFDHEAEPSARFDMAQTGGTGCGVG
jgi:hypothetical protein